MSLYDTDDPAVATEAQITALEEFGYKREAVARWRFDKAEMTLRACRRDAEDSLKRQARAISADSTFAQKPRGVASVPERLFAAEFLAACLHPDDVLHGLWTTAYVLTDAEVRWVRDQMVRIMRSVPDVG